MDQERQIRRWYPPQQEFTIRIGEDLQNIEFCIKRSRFHKGSSHILTVMPIAIVCSAIWTLTPVPHPSPKGRACCSATLGSEFCQESRLPHVLGFLVPQPAGFWAYPPRKAGGFVVSQSSTPSHTHWSLHSHATIPNPVGCFLKNAQLFDNVEFGVSAKDAIAMTASTRRQIELSFLALLDSGIDYRGRKVGSFAAGTNTEALAPVRHPNPFVFVLL